MVNLLRFFLRYYLLFLFVALQGFCFFLIYSKNKYNQAAFIDGDKRFVFRAGKWMYAPVGANGQEPTFEYVEKNFNPIQELQMPVLRKKYLEETFSEFTAFSDKVMSKIKT